MASDDHTAARAGRHRIGGMELTNSDEPGGDIQALRERLSKLSEASLRICESLDVDTVLREVVESARALTGAGCRRDHDHGRVGHLQDFVTAGVSPEDYQRFLHLPHGPGLWEYLRQVPQPLRLRDLAAHLGPLGFPADPRWRGASWGRRSATGACRWATSSGRQGGRAGVHPGGRGGAGAVRLAGRGGDRQCPRAPGRATGAGGPGSVDRDPRRWAWWCSTPAADRWCR